MPPLLSHIPKRWVKKFEVGGGCGYAGPKTDAEAGSNGTQIGDPWSQGGHELDGLDRNDADTDDEANCLAMSVINHQV